MSYTPQFRTAVRTDVPLILQMIRDQIGRAHV